ncbi:MAG TPA: uroporphyrinogen decarboxylase [Parachlamydiales bacterium]|nr:uroporphyrinogen decarboxylase [Parachlamydiales bacterium]
MSSSLLLQALAGSNQKRPPVWLMRQAGRYLPDYQAMRRNHSLFDLFFTPELASKATLMPLEQIGVDAAILFSDITVIALALGFKLDFQEGPVIEPLLQTASDVEKLPCLDVKETLGAIGETVKLSLSSLPLIGFCGGPFTVASYLIEKHVGSDLLKTKQWLYRDPMSFHVLLDKITQVSSEYLRMQVENGVEAIQIFDSWAHVLTDEQFRQVCLPYWKRLLDAVDVPGIVFARGNSFRVQAIQSIRPAAISIDWQLPVSLARSQTSLPLQGNLDPDLLFAPVSQVKAETIKLLDSMRRDPGFIVNLGHGIKPNTPVESVKCLVDTVKNYGH